MTRVVEELGRDTVHVWTVAQDAIVDRALLARYEALLTEEERERWQRFYFARHRHQYLVTRALMRTMLSQYDDVEPEAWSFVRNEYGKPAIAGPRAATDLRFNLSNTEGLIVGAVCRGGEIGVDVEAFERGPSIVEIADTIFSDDERAQLFALPDDPSRDRRGVELWVLKEAYIKAVAFGLSLPLKSFSMLERDGAFTLVVGGRSTAWRVSLHAHREHLVGLAVEGDRRVVVRDAVPFVSWGSSPSRDGG